MLSSSIGEAHKSLGLIQPDLPTGFFGITANLKISVMFDVCGSCFTTSTSSSGVSEIRQSF